MWELLSPSPAQAWLAHSWSPTRSYLKHLWSLCLDEGQEFARMTFNFISCPSIPFSYFLQDIDVLWFALYPWRRLWRYAMKKIISIASRLLISQWVHESAISMTFTLSSLAVSVADLMCSIPARNAENCSNYCLTIAQIPSPANDSPVLNFTKINTSWAPTLKRHCTAKSILFTITHFHFNMRILV